MQSNEQNQVNDETTNPQVEAPAEAPKAEKKIKKKGKAKAKQVEAPRRGRPAVFGKKEQITIVAVAKRTKNLKRAVTELRTKGGVYAQISVPTVAKIAHAAGLAFQRGRPKATVAKPVAKKGKKTAVIQADAPAVEETPAA